MFVRARRRLGALPLSIAAIAAAAFVASTPALSAGADPWPERGATARASAHAAAEVLAVSAMARPRPMAAAVAPLGAPHGRISSAYGYRMSNRSRRRRFHAGVDFEAPRGSEVRAVRAGLVEAVPRNRERNTGFGGYGNAVVVRHEDEAVWVLYAHLDSVDVRPGDRIVAGQRLGAAGRTSNRKFPDMAPHLHLEVRVATPEGESPFPGRYRRHNVNPRCWFARHGLYYDADGELGSRSSAPPARCRR